MLDLKGFCVGSPPHGRGKDCRSLALGCQLGITPAWAGKRQTRAVHGRRDKDHPRVGGEKLHLDVFCNNCEGSPPRGRGKVSTCCLLSPLDRITPAWAGKRYYPFAVILLDRDHPRVGGEKSPVRIKALPNSGSPPRGRGKVPCVTCPPWVPGITPAWAGKSNISPLAQRVNKDHPRVGGEKPMPRNPEELLAGSPPRGRGKD